VRNVGKREVVEQTSPVRLEGVAIRSEQCMDPLEQHIGIEAGQLIKRDDQWWIADDPLPPVDNVGQLSNRLQAVAGVRLREHGFGCLEVRFLFFS
jgi:hypothetical protein